MRPGRARGGHHLLQEGKFELVAEADFGEAMRASQAGCRGFEPRLSLFPLQLHLLNTLLRLVLGHLLI